MKSISIKLFMLSIFMMVFGFSFPCISLSAAETIQESNPVQTTDSIPEQGSTEQEVNTTPVTPAPEVVPATLKISKTSITLNRNKSKTLKVSRSSSAPAGKIIWTSSNKKVASVNSKGKVKAKKKGKATITACIQGTKIKAKCKVSVTNIRTMRVKATAYCGCRKCNGGYTRTASGKKPKAGRTIAVDRRLIPLGTKVKIKGKTYIAEDTGGSIKGKKIDIFMSSHAKTGRFGVRYLTIKVYY